LYITEGILLKSAKLVESNKEKDWLIFAEFLTGDREMSLDIVKAFLKKPSTTFFAPCLIERGYRYILKHWKTDDSRTILDSLLSEYSLNSLGKINQSILLLHYYFQLDIRKIARIIGKSIREIRRRLYLFLQLLASNGIPLATFVDRLLEKGNSLAYPFSLDDLNKGNLINAKKTVLYSFIILHLLIVGGAMNSGIVEKTQAKQGPDLLMIYKGNKLDEMIKSRLTEVFQEDGFSVFVNFEEAEVYIGVEKEELYQKKSEIIRFVYQQLKEKDITYAVQLDYDKKAFGIDEAAYQIVSEAKEKRLKLWPGDYSDQGKVIGWIVSFPDDIELVTEESELRRVQEIIHKYHHKAPVTVSYYNKQIVDRRERWLKLSPYFNEGFLLGKEYNIERIRTDTTEKNVIIDIYTFFLTKDKKKEEIARAIKRSLDQFLQSEEIKGLVQNDTYTINIYSAGKKKINVDY